MTGTEQTRGQWCHCGGWWLVAHHPGTVPEPLFGAGMLHDVYTCGGAA